MESPRTKAKCAREQRKEKEEVQAATVAGHPAPGPDIRPLKMSTTAATQQPKCYRARTSGQAPDIRPLPQARIFGTSPEIRRPSQNVQKLDLASPDIRPSARTSGVSGKPGHPAPPACVQCIRAESPCTPSPLRLYILPLHLRFRVSIGLAHLR